MPEHIVIAILLSLAGICVICVIYPYALYPLILRAMPPKSIDTRSEDSDSGREFALLFCAYNESRAMPAKIANLQILREQYPNLEIHAYDDHSSDGTADMLEEAGLGIHVVRGPGRSGKAHGMKVLASQTDREFLVFTDANVELSPDVFHRLRNAYADPSVGGICGVLEYVDDEGTPTAHAGNMYWRLEETLKSLESRSGNVMGADGSIFSIRKRLYPEFPDTVLDDMTVSMSVIFQGFRLIKYPLVIARERLVASKGDDVRRRIRISMRCYHTHLWMRPRLRRMSLDDRWRWWSHKFLRWHGSAFIIAGYLCVIAAISLSLNWIVAIIFLMATILFFSLGYYLRLGPLSTLVHLVLSILMTGIGVARALRGRTVSVWNPPAR